MTEAAFDGLVTRQHGFAKVAEALRNNHAEQAERVKALEVSVAAIKDLLAKGGAVGPAAEKRRADFIASGRMGDAS